MNSNIMNTKPYKFIFPVQLLNYNTILITTSSDLSVFKIKIKLK